MAVRPQDFQAPSLDLPNTRTVRVADPDDSLRTAGWTTGPRLKVPRRAYESLRWSNLRTLIAARDEKVAKRMNSDPAGAMRRAWVQSVGPNALGPLPLACRERGARRVLLVGDTGDGSEAQAAVAEHLFGRADRPGAQFKSPEVDALLIESDVVYPAGAAAEYDRKFRRFYEKLVEREIPVYAVPGNHDWNDGSLSGFMSAFCGARTRPAAVNEARRQAPGSIWRRPLASWPFWTDGSRGELPAPSSLPADPPQRTPYLALDIDGALFIGIDTGYHAFIDPEQAKWLVDLVESHPAAPKVLFTGKPLIVNGKRQPCCFSSDGTHVHSVPGEEVEYKSVDDVVRRPENGFVAAIGGDVHNYQRYLAHIVVAESGRKHVLPYVVCGGGGVFIAQTGWLEYIDAHELVSEGHVQFDELETVLFPPRAHSRLYLDAVIRQAARRVRFTLPIALAVAAVVGSLLWIGRPWIPLPDLRVDLALLLTAAAVNISARPISRKGRVAPLLLAAAAASLGVWCAKHGVTVHGWSLSRHDTRWAIAGGLVLGNALLQVGESEFLSASRGWRRLGTAVSAVAGAAIIGGSALAILASASDTRTARWVALGVGVSAIALTSLPWLLVGRVSVADAFGKAARALDRRALPDRRVRLLAKNQRFFSFFETFTNGRLEQRARLKGRRGRPHLPLYRSLLEIEFQRVPDKNTWQFAFTAFAVTGEASKDTGDSDAAPVIADAFTVEWTPSGGGRIRTSVG